MSRSTPTRDAAIDLVRALCVVGVVVLHSLMVGVTLTPDGPLFANAGESGWWLVPVSWALQVMPLFFVIGGFAGYTAYRRMQDRGRSGTDFVVGRIHRLLLPAAAVVGTAGIGLTMLGIAGVPGDLIAIAGYRFAQPLWFLAVFLLCQTLLPALTRAHRAAPGRTVLALAGSAVAVDVLRGATGIEALGFLNLAFVWLTLQQLGFFLAEGRIDALSRRTRMCAGATALALLVAFFATGVYSPDLIANINPPTVALILVGVVHTSAFSLLRTPIAALATGRRIAVFTAFVSERAMTIYLWHMSVLLVLAGGSALLASASLLSLPVPASAGWWLGRPLWLALALGITALISVPLARIETLRPPTGRVPTGRAATAAVIGTASVAMLLIAGTSTVTAAFAVAMMLSALLLAAPPSTSPLTAPRPVLLGAV